MYVQNKSYALAEQFCSLHSVDRGGPGDLVLVNSLQSIRGPCMVRKQVFLQLEWSNENNFVSPRGIHLAIIKPSASVMAAR